MDNSGSSNPSPNQDSNKSIPLADDTKTVISHSPLNLGGSTAAPAPKPKAKVTTQPIGSVVKKVDRTASSSVRITGVRTFFVKLHPGAIKFLDEQISDWLKDNPGVKIKQTNTTVGEIQGKKTESNIIVTVWY